MRAHLLQADAQSGDVAAVDAGAVAHLGDVGFGAGENLQEAVFERGAGGAEELGRKLQHAAGVGDDLDGLDAGDLVEEPAAAGVHELGVAFQLEQLKQSDALFGRDAPPGVECEEAVDRGRRAVEDDVDVVVARSSTGRCSSGAASASASGAVASRRKSSASRRGARHCWFTAGLAAVAAAVGAPAFDAMHAAPGGVFDHLGLPLRRELFQELAVVGERCVAVRLDPVHGIGERHLAVLVVVAVALAVGGDVRELDPVWGVGGARGSRPAGGCRRPRRC